MTALVVAQLTNGAYGVGRGGRRRVKPFVLACIHVTANARTAAYPDLHAAAMGERNYANRAGSNGPSATGYVARDGWAVLAVDPDLYFPWSNGDLKNPNTSNPGIRRVLALHAKGYNANEAYWEEWELLGDGTAYPILAAQERFVAGRIAARAKKSGLPINRETVHGHWEINGIDRRNCPVAWALREVFLNRIITLARAIYATGTPVPVPVPKPPAEDTVNAFPVPEARTLVVLAEDPNRPGNSVWMYRNSARTADGGETSLDPKPFREMVLVSDAIVPGVAAIAYETAAGDTNTTSQVYFVRSADIVSRRVVVLDPRPAVNAALDKVLANAKAGSDLAIEKAVAGARPAA